MTSALRLNARLDPQLGAKLARTRARTGKSITAIVTAALERYCEETQEAAPLAEILSDVGLLGCVEGPRDLSTHYKGSLGDLLATKTSRARK